MDVLEEIAATATKAPQAQVVGNQAPRIHVVCPYTTTLGSQAVKLAKVYGIDAFPWQEFVLNDWMAVDEEGKWVHPTCYLNVRRQQGKTMLLIMRIIWGLIRGERQLVTAHRFDSSRDLFLAVVNVFENTPSLAKYLAKPPLKSAGFFELVTINGGYMWAGTRSGFGRGKPAIDLVIIDEDQAYNSAEQSDIEPTTSMSPNPQVIMTGTPPTSKDEDGEIARLARNRALKGKLQESSFCEWSAKEDKERHSHLDDVEQWKCAAPSMGISSFTYEKMRSERGKFMDHVFEVECLGIFKDEAYDAVIPLQTFRDQYEDYLGEMTELTYAVDMTQDRSSVAIAVAGLRTDTGQPHVSLVAWTGGKRRMSDQYWDGIDWVVPLMADMVAKNPPKAVVIDGNNQAVSLLDSLKREGVRVTTTTLVDVATGCGKLYDGFMSGSITQTGGLRLEQALMQATTKPIRDAWKMVPRAPGGDITPIQAVMLALWGATTSKSTRRAYRPRGERGLSRSRQAPKAMF